MIFTSLEEARRYADSIATKADDALVLCSETGRYAVFTRSAWFAQTAEYRRGFTVYYTARKQ